MDFGEYQQRFEPDPRFQALCERLLQYYKATPDNMSNRDALPHWRAFRLWCRERGYTPEEINRAKRLGLDRYVK